MTLLNLLTDKAVLVCNHETGIVTNRPSQSLVTIEGSRILIEDDPEHRPIKGCTMTVLPTIKPCSITLKVKHGYSDLLRIDGHRVCLQSIIGLTDWAGADVNYKVRTPGQNFVAEAEV
jgi:hypothetical protein